jgi:acetyl esterase/lipase
VVTFALAVIGLPGLRKISNLPTFEKSYPSQKTLKNRVFSPKSLKSGDALLPLYLDIHGGGFALGSPCVDDRFCSEFANDNKILVVALDYPKAPDHPFPAAIISLIDTVNAILEDETLPIDKSKVAIGGFSAGANLSLAVSQDESLQGRIGGLVSFYGPLDFTEKTSDKMATRPKDSGSDPLENIAPMVNWAYINQLQDPKDPLLSVGFAPKTRLPPKLYIFGCEQDMLCKESEILAERLATEGSGESVNPSDSWEKNGVRWEKILGEKHGV